MHTRWLAMNCSAYNRLACHPFVFLAYIGAEEEEEGVLTIIYSD